MTTTIAGGAATLVKCSPKMPGAPSSSKTASYCVPSTLKRRHCRSSGSSSSRNNFRGCTYEQNLPREDVWTAVANTTSRPPSNPGRTCRRGSGLGRPSKNSYQRICPYKPARRVIEPHATMEHSRVSWSALRAGPPTAARICRSHGLGPAWIDNESYWAVPLEDVPEDV
jgi:hypothetical protein